MRLIISILLAHLAILSYGQSLTDVSFELNPTDLEAKIRPVLDGNGEPCALIKVVVPPHLENLVFESSYIVKTEYREFEYFVWVADGAKKLTLKHKDYSPINKKFDSPLNKNLTYVWNISVPEPKAQIFDVAISINAKNAEIIIDGISYGNASTVKLEEGPHDIIIDADNYVSENRQIQVTETSTQFDFILDPVEKEYYSLLVMTNSDKSKLYIDGVSMGKCGVPVKVAKGNHSIKIKTSSYKTIEQDFYLGQDEELRFELDKTGMAKFMNGIGTVGAGILAVGAALESSGGSNSGNTSGYSSQSTSQSYTPSYSTSEPTDRNSTRSSSRSSVTRSSDDSSQSTSRSYTRSSNTSEPTNSNSTRSSYRSNVTRSSDNSSVNNNRTRSNNRSTSNVRGNTNSQYDSRRTIRDNHRYNQ